MAHVGGVGSGVSDITHMAVQVRVVEAGDAQIGDAGRERDEGEAQ